MAQDDISFTDLIASSIHDMKNSLNVQISELEKISDQCKKVGDLQAYEDLGGVIYQANRMNSNLIQLLSLYKLDKAIYPVDIAECSIAELIGDVLLQNRSVMDFKKIELSMDCSDDCVWYVDRDLVAGVLLNALNNAYQYTQDKIRVTAQIKEVGRSRLNLLQSVRRDGEVLAEGEIHLVCVSMEGFKPVSVPEVLRKQWKV